MARGTRATLGLVLLCLGPALLAAAPAAGAAQRALPDLVVAKVSRPAKVLAGGSKLKVTIRVRNRGSAKARRSRVGVYLAEGRKRKPPEKPAKRVKLKALDTGGRARIRLRIRLPQGGSDRPFANGPFRLVACADDTDALRESAERNCVSTRTFMLAPRAPAGRPAPAFTIADGLDWGTTLDDNEHQPTAGEPVTVTLTAGNGIAGAAGYTSATIAGAPLLGGAETNLGFSSPVDTTDDGSLGVALPFAFPFGGVYETTANVSTNGRIGFGDPVVDYWNDTQLHDYRGVRSVVGGFFRGIMPYWGDLDAGDQGSGPGTVKMFVPDDRSYAAFRWDVGQHNLGGSPRRLFQLVLFPDGRFRFDYPGGGEKGGNEAFAGYSLGTGYDGAEVVAASTTEVLTESLLFTPNPVAAGPSQAGEAWVSLPGGSSLIAADRDCSLSYAAGQYTAGSVLCRVQGLAAGEQAQRRITFSMPANAVGQTSPANFKLLGRYRIPNFNLADDDEVNRLSHSLETATLDLSPSYVSPTAKVGVPGTFEVELKAGALDEPRIGFDLSENTTFVSATLAGQAFDCDPPTERGASCRLPSGSGSSTIEVKVVPTAAAAGSEIRLVVSASALNASSGATTIAYSPPVVP
jgi:hypothetical protein